MLANVKIEQDKQHEIIHRVFVNGKKWKESIMLISILMLPKFRK